MSTIPLDVFLRIVDNVRDDRERARERYSRMADMGQIHMMLGAEDACRLIRRRLESYADAEQLLAAEHQYKSSRRVLRDRHRQVARSLPCP